MRWADAPQFEVRCYARRPRRARTHGGAAGAHRRRRADGDSTASAIGKKYRWISVRAVPRGRPLKPVDADASCAARLGAVIRGMRVAQNLTLHALASRIGYSPSHISDVELAQASASNAFVTACDRVLDAQDELLALYPAVRIEQVQERESRETSRQGAYAPARRSMT
jgi:ribosome-binding protein aMBF1 (putative translation factor)